MGCNRVVPLYGEQTKATAGYGPHDLFTNGADVMAEHGETQQADKNSVVHTLALDQFNRIQSASQEERELAKTDRVAATKQLTDTLSSRLDVMIYTGKGMYRLLDGNQACIYNPSVLVRVNKKLAQPGEIGSKVVRNVDGMRGVLMGRRPIDEQFAQYHNGEPEFLDIKWQRGGRDMNTYPSQVDFV